MRYTILYLFICLCMNLYIFLVLPGLFNTITTSSNYLLLPCQHCCSPCCCNWCCPISSGMLFIYRTSSSIVLNNCHMFLANSFWHFFGCSLVNLSFIHSHGRQLSARRRQCFARLKINPATDCHWPAAFCFLKSLPFLLFWRVKCGHPHIWMPPFSIFKWDFHELMCALLIKGNVCLKTNRSNK